MNINRDHGPCHAQFAVRRHGGLSHQFDGARSQAASGVGESLCRGSASTNKSEAKTVWTSSLLQISSVLAVIGGCGQSTKHIRSIAAQILRICQQKDRDDPSLFVKLAATTKPSPPLLPLPQMTRWMCVRIVLEKM